MTIGLGGTSVIFLWHNIKISTGPQKKFCNVYGLQFNTTAPWTWWICCGHVPAIPEPYYYETHYKHETYVDARLVLSMLMAHITEMNTKAILQQQTHSVHPFLPKTLELIWRFQHFTDELALSEYGESDKLFNIYPANW